MYNNVPYEHYLDYVCFVLIVFYQVYVYYVAIICAYRIVDSL
jgi:hypothetical protein